jgi:hypothetical protein
MSKAARVSRSLFVLAVMVFGLLAGLGGYYAGGRADARDDTRPLARLADRLIARGEGAAGLGAGREGQMLAALVPASEDLASDPAGGVPILAHALAKRMAFEHYTPGIGRIRLAGYASGLEAELSGPRLAALWLETVEMGRGPHGWMRGVYQASHDLYGRPPAALNDAEFARLIAAAAASSGTGIGPKPTFVRQTAAPRV